MSTFARRIVAATAAVSCLIGVPAVAAEPAQGEVISQSSSSSDLPPSLWLSRVQEILRFGEQTQEDIDKCLAENPDTLIADPGCAHRPISKLESVLAQVASWAVILLIPLGMALSVLPEGFTLPLPR